MHFLFNFLLGFHRALEIKQRLHKLHLFIHALQTKSVGREYIDYNSKLQIKHETSSTPPLPWGGTRIQIVNHVTYTWRISWFGSL